MHAMPDDEPAGTLAEYLEVEPAEGVETFYEQLEDDNGDRTPVKRWRIMSLSGAGWAMRKLRAARRQSARNAVAATEETDRIIRWLEAVNGPLNVDAEHFTGLLREWHARSLAEETGVDVTAEPVDKEWWSKRVTNKTRKLPTGDVTARRGAGQFQATGDVAVAFLKEHAPELLHWHPTVRPLELDIGVEQGDVTVRDGRYWVRLAVDEIDAEHVENVVGALFAAADDAVEAWKVADTFGFVACSAILAAHPATVLTLTQELGESARCTAWVPIPGIERAGEGRVTITVKPDLHDDTLID